MSSPQGWQVFKLLAGSPIRPRCDSLWVVRLSKGISQGLNFSGSCTSFSKGGAVAHLVVCQILQGMLQSLGTAGGLQLWCSPGPSWSSRPAVWCDYQTWLMLAGSGEVDEAARPSWFRVNSQLKIKQAVIIHKSHHSTCMYSQKPQASLQGDVSETEKNQT